ncbi:MAG: bifunctional DNA primase/polymerase [Saprospiraceae bacterium]|nr:bifunctional DNA primase/polymerase [Candidatus Defluviibacterium haderslevense]
MTHLFKLLENSGSLVPIVEDKKSFIGWNKYQTTPPTREELTNWISGSYKGFGLIMGYGDYQVIDIDIKNANTDQANYLFETVWSYIPNDLKLKITVQKTRNNGLHMIYRCKIPAIHEKILINPESKKTVVETIGAKNYILIEPSPNYKIVSGSLDDIHEISVDEHNSLIGYFKKMDTYSVNENEIKINPDLDIDLISKQIQTEGVKKRIQKIG